MNPRIKELVSQATDTIEVVNPISGITHHREFFDQEKFIRLIVLDACSVLENWKKEPFPFDEDVAVSLLKEHFGVQE